MTSRPNPTGLRIVEDSAASGNDLSLLLLAKHGDNGPRRVRVREDDVDAAQISVLLLGYWAPTGEIIRDGDDASYPSHFSFLWRGQTRTIRGEAVDPL